jgi:hypothetical protein
VDDPAGVDPRPSGHTLAADEVLALVLEHARRTLQDLSPALRQRIRARWEGQPNQSPITIFLPGA